MDTRHTTHTTPSFWFQIEIVPTLLPDYDEYTYQQDIFDTYCFTLALQHSEFWKMYGAEGKCALPPDRLGTPIERSPFFGDSNCDDAIDAKDACAILNNAAAAGCSPDMTAEEIFEACGCDITASDANQDGQTDSRDAALLLRYVVAVGTGSTASLREFAEQEAVGAEA